MFPLCPLSVYFVPFYGVTPDGAFWPLAWRLGAPVCFRHGVWLERCCPGCGAVQDFRPLAPSATCGRCATPFATARPEPYPAAITEILGVIDLGVARFAGRGEARPPRFTTPIDPPEARWRRLIAFARENAGAMASDAGDERDRLAAFLAAAVAAGVLEDPAPCDPTVDMPPASVSPPLLFDGLAERVSCAIERARGTLAARGSVVTSRALAREADRIQRSTPDSARRPGVYGLAGRSVAPTRQSTG